MTKEKKHYATLHFTDMFPLTRELLYYRRTLKRVTTDKLEKKWKLSEKSFGHQFLILLGEGVIDLKGRKAKK